MSAARASIAWATPVNRSSAIARVSMDVTAMLAERGHAVTLISTERERALDLHPTSLSMVHWSDVDPPAIAASHDHVVVNVGDHFLYHAGIFPMLEQGDAIGVFHDFYLFNLFQGWLADRNAGLDVKHGLMASIYGRDPDADDPASLEELAADTPMTEWIGAQCRAALTHAHFYAPRLLASCPGPVRVAALPMRERRVRPMAAPARKLRLVTVGVANPNKCIGQVIEAIGQSAYLIRQVEYHVAGPATPEEHERLTALAQTHGFAGLKLTGQISDALLDAELGQADIICCLRQPVLEGASGSAIEGLLAGRPVIVSDAGFYAELPDDVVFKTAAVADPAALAVLIERLARNPGLRRETGLRARAWASGHFSLERYCDQIEALMQASLEVSPVLDLGRRLGRSLSAVGLDYDDPSVARIADVLSPLLEGEQVDADPQPPSGLEDTSRENGDER